MYAFGIEVENHDNYFTKITSIIDGSQIEFTTGSSTCSEITTFKIKSPFRNGLHRAGLCKFDMTGDSVDISMTQLIFACLGHIDSAHSAGYWNTNFKDFAIRSTGSVIYKFLLEFDEYLNESNFFIDLTGLPTQKSKVSSEIIKELENSSFKITFRVNGIIRWKGTNRLELAIEVINIEI